jgi:hypothetical protein
MFLAWVRAALHTLRHVFKSRIESVKRHRRWQMGLDPKQFFDQVLAEVPHGRNDTHDSNRVETA